MKTSRLRLGNAVRRTAIRSFRWFGLLGFASAFALAQMSPPPPSDDTRNVAVSGLPPGATPSNVEFALDRGLGLFVGVNDFTTLKLSKLKYAVNDAIGLAHHFVTAGLVEPANCYLLISGEPVGDRATRQLAELREKGITPQQADFMTIRAKVQLLASAQASNFILLAFCTHGFYKGETSYIIPRDGDVDHPEGGGAISSAFIRESLDRSAAKKTLFIVDACRATMRTDVRTPNEMTDKFRDAFNAARGRAALFACTSGQVSYESDPFQHGVFTHFLLEGLGGAASADPTVADGAYITLGALIDYVSPKVHTWIQQEHPGAGDQQDPALDGANALRQMPIARSADGERVLTEIVRRRGAAMDLLTAAFRRPALQPKFGDTGFPEISFALASLPARPGDFATSPLGKLISMTESQLATPSPITVEAYVAWWNDRKAELSNGSVKLITEPAGASLVVDGINTPGLTPLEWKLPPGPHALTVNLAGHESFSRNVVVKPGATVDLGKIALAAIPLPILSGLEAANLKLREPFERTIGVKNGPARLSVTGLPAGLSFDPASLKISGAPTASGAFLAHITATGNRNVQTSDTLEFHVEAPPTVAIPRVTDGEATLYTDEVFEYDVKADGDPTEYSARNLPAGLSIDRTTGRITGTARTIGTTHTAIYAKNSAGRGSGELVLDVRNRIITASPPSPPGPVVTPIYTRTFWGGGQLWHALPDGRVIDAANGNLIGYLTPSSLPNTSGLISLVTGVYLQLGNDGVLYYVSPNGYGGLFWQPRGNWRLGG